MADEDLVQQGDDTDPSDQPETFDEETGEPGVEECDVLEVEMMEATATALGSVSAIEFAAKQSAIASATVEGDAEVSTSIIGVMNAGSVGLYQGMAAVALSEGELAVDQGLAGVLVARGADLESSGACVVIAGEASVARSWVGLMAARNATLSDDSRVVIDTRSALIIGGALLGGLVFLGLAGFFGARAVAAKIPRLPFARGRHTAHHLHVPALPTLHLPEMPDLPQIGELVAKLRHAE